MKVQDRLVAVIENAQMEIDNINEKVDSLMRDLEKWRTRRLEIEEEAVEARVALSVLRDRNLKVGRNADGIIEASVDPVEAA
jgi:FtsZ-binding cell division protein ZapB